VDTVRQPEEPPVDDGDSLTASRRGTALPPDLLREASRRLGLLALVAVALALIDLTLGHTLFAHLSRRWRPLMEAISGGTVACSLGVFLYTRWSKRAPATFITLGLAYEVLLGAGLAVLNHTFLLGNWMTGAPLLSRVGFLIVVFAAVVPATPRRTLVVALITATMDPLVMAAAIASGYLAVPYSHIFVMHLPNYIAVGVAVVLSHVITRLGREVRDARELGSYRVGRLIGRGGMGEVYHATHRMLQRPAAIKLIRPEALEHRSPDRVWVTVERFRREAEAAASLRSPHTIDLYDFGVTDDGIFYYVMELLDGVDLDALVERFGPVPPERAVHLLRQACDSLAEAHERGLMHRDIKPSNIHTCRLGLTVDFVKLLDFGLVKARDGRDAGAPALTQDTVIPGTPAFMAPESVFGEPPPDHRADLYALGCVGYWLLTGTLVFEALTPARMLAQHLEAAPTPPSRRAEVEVPAGLEALIMACLAKRPQDRPASAAELSRRFAECEVSSPWTDERAREWWDRHLPRGVEPVVARASDSGSLRGSSIRPWG
jgi:serine/threonine-protein kinase